MKAVIDWVCSLDRNCFFRSCGLLTVGYPATCSSDLSIKVWDVENGFSCLQNLMGHEKVVSAISFADGKQQLVSCSHDETIKVWNIEGGYCEKTIRGHEHWVRHVDVDRSGSLVASASRDKVSKFFLLENSVDTDPFIKRRLVCGLWIEGRAPLY